MDTKKLKRIEDIYHAIADVDPAVRDQFLAENCGDDIELLREVESLLSFSRSAISFLETPPESLAAEMFSGIEDASLIGRKIEQYEIRSLLGKGGMGAVYLAYDTKLDRKVALKFLPREFAEESGRLRRFIREAKSTSALNHPNIITIHEIGESGGIHFIATEYVDGKTLGEYAKDNSLSYRSVLEIAIQIASALDAAHSSGIVHRDIKPDNVMIRPDGFAKILDFGIAKLAEHRTGDIKTDPAGKQDSNLISPSFETSLGLIVGTPNYMSPEQAGGREVGHQTDIFSFGIVFYELLTGRLPFAGDSSLDMISSIVNMKPRPIDELLPDLPIEIVNIVNSALDKDIGRRYQTARKLLDDLKAASHELEFKSRMEGAMYSIEKPNSTKTIFDDQTRENAQAVDSGDPIFTPATRERGKNISTDKGSRFRHDDPGNAEIVSNFAKFVTASPDGLPPNNLSGQFTPFFGRESEVAEVLKLISEPDVKLLTITGVGGTGKTRLSERITQILLPKFRDGVFCVRLASISDPQLVLPIIAQTLGVREEGGRSLLECLITHIGDKEMLILLDNFEHVIDSSKLIAELLEALKFVKFLITSRVRLNLSLEHEFTLHPFEIPDAKELTAIELSKFPSVELFVKTARSVKYGFSLTDENAHSIGEICRRLDGLPLAIELAAARVKLFSPDAILARLENSLDLLTGGARDLPERQQTIRGAIAWSYDLLEPEETELFERLSVFRGGFTLDDAEFVANRESLDPRQIPASDPAASIKAAPMTLDLISSLVDKSLLVQRQQPDGEPQFRMLVVVREFAFEKLQAAGNADKIRRFHAEHYCELSENAAPHLRGSQAVQWLEKLDQEHDNLRAALEWGLENDPQLSLRIAASINKFWTQRG
ncbi:MAG: protein kinase, partial [Acidobacteria bacterium]|nr:protein kinase [Acidobacteriota bacterium]